MTPSKTCAQCDEPATKRRNQTHLCVVHYRIQQMRQDSQVDSKPIPTRESLESLVGQIVESGMVCVFCDRVMNWLKKDGIKTIVTLQHDRNGGFRLICLSCNTRHQHFPGDSFYATPKGHKLCTRCKQVKPFEEFYPHVGNGVNARRSRCRVCDLAVARDDRLANGDAVRARCRAYSAANRDRVNAAKRANRARRKGK